MAKEKKKKRFSSQDTFKAKLTITYDDFVAKFYEAAIKTNKLIKKSKSEEANKLFEKRQLEWKAYHDELNIYDYDGVFGIPDDEHASRFVKSLFFEARYELFYNVKNLREKPLHPFHDIKFNIDSHESLQNPNNSRDIWEIYSHPSQAKDKDLYERNFRFLYRLWCYVQKGPDSIKDTGGYLAAKGFEAQKSQQGATKAAEEQRLNLTTRNKNICTQGKKDKGSMRVWNNADVIRAVISWCKDKNKINNLEGRHRYPEGYRQISKILIKGGVIKPVKK